MEFLNKLWHLFDWMDKPAEKLAAVIDEKVTTLIENQEEKAEEVQDNQEDK